MSVIITDPYKVELAKLCMHSRYKVDMCIAVDSMVTLKYICCISCSCSRSASLVPPAPQREVWYSLLAHVPLQLCADLPYPYAEDYTIQECKVFFEINSSRNSTCTILLQYYFWPVGSHSNTYIPSYMACSCSIFNMIGLYN